MVLKLKVFRITQGKGDLRGGGALGRQELPSNPSASSELAGVAQIAA
jgi:hypothetical protein